MTPEAQVWLRDFQRSFGAAVRTPLDASTGHLRAQPSHYDAQLCAQVSSTAPLTAAARLALYNRQYWYRLLRVMQNEYPLLSRLMGAWAFNGLTLRFLGEQPPRSHDIARVADGFDGFLETHTQHAALQQAAALDSAYRRSFFAPEETPFSVPRDYAHTRLQLSAAFMCIEEDWPLLQLRATVRHQDNERPVPLPPPLAAARHWALARRRAGIEPIALQPEQARFYELLRSHSLTEALEHLQTDCPDALTENLPSLVQAWMKQAIDERWLVASRSAG